MIPLTETAQNILEKMQDWSFIPGDQIKGALASCREGRMQGVLDSGKAFMEEIGPESILYLGLLSLVVRNGIKQLANAGPYQVRLDYLVHSDGQVVLALYTLGVKKTFTGDDELWSWLKLGDAVNELLKQRRRHHAED